MERLKLSIKKESSSIRHKLTKRKIEFKSLLWEYTKGFNLVCIPLIYNEKNQKIELNNVIEQNLFERFPNYKKDILFIFDNFEIKAHITHGVSSLMSFEYGYIVALPLNNYEVMESSLKIIKGYTNLFKQKQIIIPRFKFDDCDWSNVEDVLKELEISNYKFITLKEIKK